MSDVRSVRRALVAVFDKGGVVELARGLTELGVEIVSSGGTAATLREAGIDVTPGSSPTAESPITRRSWPSARSSRSTSSW
jgi:AICAR transformylase/IMP cyclohydrolase PurH